MFPVRKVVTDIIDVSVTLFKIMIPTLIVVKLLQEIGTLHRGWLLIRRRSVHPAGFQVIVCCATRELLVFLW